jgi:hypothetical protein
VGCITHAAINRYNRERPSNTLPAINNKHDSFLALVLDNDISTTAKHMQECLAISLTGRDGMNFTMKSEAQAGKNWGKFSKENPQGMRDLA